MVWEGVSTIFTILISTSPLGFVILKNRISKSVWRSRRVLRRHGAQRGRGKIKYFHFLKTEFCGQIYRHSKFAYWHRSGIFTLELLTFSNTDFVKVKLKKLKKKKFTTVKLLPNCLRLPHKMREEFFCCCIATFFLKIGALPYGLNCFIYFHLATHPSEISGLIIITDKDKDL